MLRNFVSSKSFSVLSHEKDLKIRREAGISWVIFKSHLLEMCIIQYCKYKEGERLHHTLRGHYQNSEFLWYVFSFLFCFFFSFQFLQIHLNWCNIERWVIQVLMLPSMCSQKLLLPQCWPFYKDTISPDSIDYQRIRCNSFFFFQSVFKAFKKHITDFQKLVASLGQIYIVWFVTFTCPQSMSESDKLSWLMQQLIHVFILFSSSHTVL